MASRNRIDFILTHNLIAAKLSKNFVIPKKKTTFVPKLQKMGDVRKKRIRKTAVLAAVAVVAVATILAVAAGRNAHRKKTIAAAEELLDSTATRVKNHLDMVEKVTNEFVPIVTANMQPDSLLAYTRQVVDANPDINGCSITTETDFFPQLGRFSVYSVREKNHITTVREADYDYYAKEWYKGAKTAGKAVWVDPYDDFNAGTLFSPEMIASYSVPLYDDAGHFIGVISTDIALPKLAEAVGKPEQPNDAYFMMTGKNGDFLVYPDSDRLVYHTIFDGVNPRMQPDIISLGNAMKAGQKGQMSVDFDGCHCIVLYQPLPQAGWSIALVCPESGL